MSKIINFKSKQDKLNDWIEESIDFIKSNNCKSMLVLAKTQDDEFITGYFRMDTAERNEAIGHIQADILMQVVKDNILDLVDIINE